MRWTSCTTGRWARPERSHAGRAGERQPARRAGDRRRRRDQRVGAGSSRWSCWAGLFLPAYNLEWAGGRVHGDAVVRDRLGRVPGVHRLLRRTRCRSRCPACCRARLPGAERRPASPELAGARAAPAHELGCRPCARCADGSTEQLSLPRLLAPLDGALAALSLAVVAHRLRARRRAAVSCRVVVSASGGEQVRAGAGARPRSRRAGGVRSGANRPSTQPPKPPPMMRAPAAPAVAQRARRSPRRRAWRSESRRAGSRARRRAGVRAPACRPSRSAATAVATRCVLAEHVARAPAQRLGQALGVGGASAWLSVATPSSSRTPARTPRGARCSRRRRARGARRSRARPAASRRGAAARARSSSVREVDAQRAVGLRRTARRAGRAGRSARRPSRSPRARTAARLRACRALPARTLVARRRSAGGSRSPASASSARHSATSSAAEEDSPAPRGRSPPICSARAGRRRAGVAQLGDGAAHERAPAVARARRSSSANVVVARRGRRRARLTRRSALARARDDDALRDRERQREAAVVVGVLADQVDAPGRERRGALRRHGRSPRAARRPTPPAACRR